MHIDNIDDQEIQILLDSLVAFNLIQHVRIPIHNRHHTLDILITTTEEDSFKPTYTIAGPSISDHRLIILETSETKLETKIERQKSRKINKSTIHEFCENFNNDPIMQVTTLEEAVNIMDEEILRTFDLVTPTKVVEAKMIRPKPWYDLELKQQRKILKNRGFKWFKYREDIHWHV